MGGADEPISEIEQLRQLFEKAPGFMAATHGPTHIYQMANASYLELVGPRELIGRSVAEAFPDLADTGFVALLDKVYASGEAHSGRSAPLWLRRRPDGPLELRHLDYVFQPITTRAGRVTGLFVEGYDITDRHEAELALRESEERFRLIADSAPVPIWVTKLDRNRGFVNRAYVDFLGISYEEAVDFDWRSVLHPDDLDRVVAESVAGETSMQTFVLEARYRRATANGAGCARNRSRASVPMASMSVHRGRSRHHRSQQAEEALERRVAAEVRSGCARRMRSPGAEDGGGRPAHRRDRARLQQSADPDPRRPRLIFTTGERRAHARIAGAALESARRGPSSPASCSPFHDCSGSA
jgi:PAS domain S-box-containing protein